MHGGGKGRGKELTSRLGIVAGKDVHAVMGHGERSIQRLRLARKRVGVLLEVSPECVSEGLRREHAQRLETFGQREIGRPLIGKQPLAGVAATPRPSSDALHVASGHVGERFLKTTP